MARAIELTGTIDSEHQLVLDQPIPLDGPRRVRVLILIPEDLDDEQEFLRAAMAGGGFDDLADPREDIYSLEDGKPYRAQG